VGGVVLGAYRDLFTVPSDEQPMSSADVEHLP
jgi:hypothetical protein